MGLALGDRESSITPANRTNFSPSLYALTAYFNRPCSVGISTGHKKRRALLERHHLLQRLENGLLPLKHQTLKGWISPASLGNQALTNLYQQRPCSHVISSTRHCNRGAIRHLSYPWLPLASGAAANRSQSPRPFCSKFIHGEGTKETIPVWSLCRGLLQLA